VVPKGGRKVMLVITIARKPLSEGTVAKNVLVHGTGGLNIDASRISSGADYHDVATTVRYGQTAMAYMGSLQTRPWVLAAMAIGKPVKESAPAVGGRWPANLILSHLPTCQCMGTKDIPASPPTPSGMDRMNAALAVQGYRPNEYQKGTPVPPKDRRNPDGTETVPVWQCVAGCPVAALDEQSGILKSPSPYVQKTRIRGDVYDLGSLNDKHGKISTHHGDTGGASRFFKVVRSI
jgi:site-specific DNA-methyltransferase (adenine-specific)